MLPRLQEIIILRLGAVFLPSLVFSGGSMFVFKVKKFKKCSAVHKVKGKRVLLALSSIHSTWAYFSAEILSRLLCLYVMHEGHFLLFTADAQFIHILKKKKKRKKSLQSLTYLIIFHQVWPTSSSSSASFPSAFEELLSIPSVSPETCEKHERGSC